ncbi:MAG TPA: glycosyltransferase family 87 protein [Caulobacteraceae bacterium]|nr:glycosyltransferase family 87 protein [Caulobacteraceae bacterium]
MGLVRPALAALAAGDWLTPQRRRNYALILILAFGLALVALLATERGGLDLAGRPIGTDFSDVWSAGRLALQGRAAAAYDPPAQYAVQQAAFHRSNVPFYAWLYPPWFLLAAAALALLPYLVAVLAWQALGLGLYVRAMRAIAPGRETTLLALAFTGVFLNLIHGQNGLLSAALIGGALFLLDKRPLAAGGLLGLLAYKPQLGLFAPLVLAASGRWRAFAAASLVVAVLALAATSVFGWGIWPAFVAGFPYTRHEVLEQGGTGFYKMQSLFAAVRLWGGSVAAAYGAQAALTLAGGALLVWLWRGRADQRLKSSALISASLLASPYCMDYDLMLLAPAGAFLVSWMRERGAPPFAAAILTLAFAAPVSTRGVDHAIGAPLGLMATLSMFGLALLAERSALLSAWAPRLLRARPA